ncbi:metallophosphoesterase family protein [soil metagenome]
MPKTTPTLFAIGDIHGHFNELFGLMHHLINDADLRPERDTVVFLGDYVDGGPDTRKVIAWCMEMSHRYPHWVFLKGNHSDMMLDALRYNSRIYGSYDLWWGQGGRETAMSYLPTDASAYDRSIMQPLDYIPQAHLDWLEERPLYHETDRHIFVHAGLRPGIPLAEQSREDMLWIRESFIESDYDFGKRVVFGHTVMPEPLVMPNKIGIDLMYHNAGWLCAVELSGDEPVFYFQEADELVAVAVAP